MIPQCRVSALEDDRITVTPIRQLALETEMEKPALSRWAVAKESDKEELIGRLGEDGSAIVADERIAVTKLSSQSTWQNWKFQIELLLRARGVWVTWTERRYWLTLCSGSYVFYKLQRGLSNSVVLQVVLSCSLLE